MTDDAPYIDDEPDEEPPRRMWPWVLAVAVAFAAGIAVKDMTTAARAQWDEYKAVRERMLHPKRVVYECTEGEDRPGGLLVYLHFSGYPKDIPAYSANRGPWTLSADCNSLFTIIHKAYAPKPETKQ